MVLLDAEVADGGAIRPQVVGDQSIGDEAVLLQQLAHELQRGKLVASGLDQHIEDLALGVDSAPQVDQAAIDLQVDLIEMPGCVRPGPASAQVGGDQRPEMVHPTPDGFVRDGNAALRQQIFDIAQTQGKSKVEPDRLLNDLGPKTVASVVIVFILLATGPPEESQLAERSDNALRRLERPANGAVTGSAGFTLADHSIGWRPLLAPVV